jgi:hypothetical protein
VQITASCPGAADRLDRRLDQAGRKMAANHSGRPPTGAVQLAEQIRSVEHRSVRRHRHVDLRTERIGESEPVCRCLPDAGLPAHPEQRVVGDLTVEL